MTQDSPFMTPGQRIKAERIKRKLSQAQLATMAGCKQSTLSELEKGESKMPSSKTLLGLSKALGVSKTWILTGHDGELEILTPEEESHVLLTRGLTAEQRRAVYELVETMATKSER